MTDFARVDMLVRIAGVPELDPVEDKVLFSFQQKRAEGYAREDDHIILDPAVTFVPEFDAFEGIRPGNWIPIAVRNEGPNVAIVVLSDDLAPAYRQRLEVGQTIFVRHFKGPASAPMFTSVLGTKLRMFAWGVPYGDPRPF